MLSKKEILIFFIFFLIYSLFSNYVGWNDESRIFTSAALVDSKNFSINEFKDFTGDRAFFQGSYYSDKAPLSSIIGVPGYIFYRIFNPPLSRAHVNINNPDYAFLVLIFDIISAFFGAASIVILYRILLLLKCHNKAIFWLILAYGFGTMAFSQSTIYNGHSLALFFLWIVVYLLFKVSERRLLFAGFVLGIAFLSDYLILLSLPCFLFYLIFLNKSGIKLTSLFIIGFSITASLLMAYNLYLFHSPFTVSYKYTDISTLGSELTYTPLFFECFPENPTIFDLVKFRFYRDCHYEEFIIYDSKNKIVSSWNSLEIKSVLINSSEEEWTYKHNYNTHKGNFSLYEKISLIPEVSGNKYTRFELSVKLKEADKEWFPVANRSISNSTKTTLFQDSYSYLVDSCTYNTPFFIRDNLDFNVTSCVVEHYSKNNNKLNSYHLSFSNISEGELNGLNYVKRNVRLSYIREDVLFAPNKFLMLLFYPYRGLFFYSPFLLLSFLGLFFAKKEKLKFAILCLFVFFTYLFTNSLFGFWWGGSSYGPRFLVYILPFLTILLSFFYQKSRKYAILVNLLIIVSVGINLIGQQSLSLSQTNAYSVNNRVRLNETYYDDLISMRGIDSPIFTKYIPLFFEVGPTNVILSKFGLNLGIINLLIFLAAVLLLRKQIVEEKA